MSATPSAGTRDVPADQAYVDEIADRHARALAGDVVDSDHHEGHDERPGTVWWGPVTLLILVALAFVSRRSLGGVFDSDRLRSGTTIFLAIVIQALPFLVLGVVVSALIAVLVPPSFFSKALPKRGALAVPVAGVAGLALPGCECGSVPIAGGLVRRGVAPAAAFTFLLAAPAINPVVLVATAAAFPNHPNMVIGRAVASALAAMAMGWLWLALGKQEWIRLPARPQTDGMSKWGALVTTMRHDFVSAAGFLVVGGVAAAVLKTVVPAEWLNAVAENPILAVLFLALLAVLLSLCSEADAFVAASLSQFSPTARLAFLVVGPMIDIKLFAMQVGTFGRRFAMRFAPVTFVVAVASSVLVGWVVL